MNNQKRRPFRPRQGKTGFRGRSNGSRPNNNNHFQNGGNSNFNRNNGSMTNPFNVEKTIEKYQQLAKDAQSLGDPVLIENYLQHADHFVRRLSELNSKSKPVNLSAVQENQKENLNQTEAHEEKKEELAEKNTEKKI
jgi:hypothetical protein